MIKIVEDWHIAKARTFPELHRVFHLSIRIERKRYPLRKYIVRLILIHYFTTPAHLLRLQVVTPFVVAFVPTWIITIGVSAYSGTFLVTVSP